MGPSASVLPAPEKLRLAPTCPLVGPLMLATGAWLAAAEITTACVLLLLRPPASVTVNVTV